MLLSKQSGQVTVILFCSSQLLDYCKLITLLAEPAFSQEIRGTLNWEVIIH